MNKTFLAFAFAALSAALAAEAREIADFNGGWEFSRDRQNWNAVDVPHDWAIEGPFEPEGDAGTGKLPWRGEGFYRKNIVIDKLPDGRVFLDFDGVMGRTVVSVNGQPCGMQEYGYLGINADITSRLCVGTNRVEVSVKTWDHASRWYPGAGMYRRVRMVKTDNLYIDERDVAVTTPEVSADKASVRVKGLVTSRLALAAKADVVVRVKSPDGKVVAKSDALAVSVDPFGTKSFDVKLAVKNPQLWQMKPNAALYTVEIGAKGGECRDAIAIRTGFRSFRFDADEGFFLNGKNVRLKGVCLHSDLGILGMAFSRSAMRRQLERMMDMGVNAIRTSHNPPSPELLDMCDEMGLFVWDEGFDKWEGTSSRKDEPLEPYIASHLEEFVRRDRNHPCVFIWSIGNEIPPAGGRGPDEFIWGSHHTNGTTAERCTRFRSAVLKHDATRPVGIAACVPEVADRNDYANLDLTGWNYQERYQNMRRRYPGKSIVYTEIASSFSETGHYAKKIAKAKTDFDMDVPRLSMDSRDVNSPDWGDIPDWEFYRMERDRFVAGGFVWTGIDYLGEPTPYADAKVNGVEIPRRDMARSSYFGICDLLAMPKDRFYLYRAYWNKDAFTLHVVPHHWNFADYATSGEAYKTPVYVYSSAYEVELFLNGKSLGRRRLDPETKNDDKDYYRVMRRYRFIWDDVTWQAGELKAVAYSKDGKKLGEESVRTAGEAKAVVLEHDVEGLSAKAGALREGEIAFVKVALADKDGVKVPRDNRRVSFKIEGPGEIVSVGNPDPRGLDSFKETSSHPLYNGVAAVAVRRIGSGKVVLSAAADGVEKGVLVFEN